jgi:hypothetical protein
MSGGRSPGQATLTVTGEDLTKTMNLADLTGLPYPGLTPEARVELIVAKYAMFGIIPLIIPSFAPDVPLPVEQIPIHQGTDLGYVRDLAAETGYVFYIDPGPVPGTNTAYWGPEIKIGVPQPALNLDMDAHTNVESLNFGFNSADTTLPIVMIQNRLTRIPIPAANSQPESAPAGARFNSRADYEHQRPARHRQDVADARAGPRPGGSRAVSGRGVRSRLTQRSALRPGVAGAAVGWCAWGGHGLRRALLREERDEHNSTRRVQAKLRAEPQRLGFNYSQSSCMNQKFYGKYRGMVMTMSTRCR